MLPSKIAMVRSRKNCRIARSINYFPNIDFINATAKPITPVIINIAINKLKVPASYITPRILSQMYGIVDVAYATSVEVDIPIIILFC